MTISLAQMKDRKYDENILKNRSFELMFHQIVFILLILSSLLQF